MIGTVQENMEKIAGTLPTPYLFTGTDAWGKLMDASKYEGEYTFDTVSNALYMAFICGYVNGHIATMQGDYKEKE